MKGKRIKFSPACKAKIAIEALKERESLGEYFLFYNQERLHQSLEYKTPETVYSIHKVAA